MNFFASPLEQFQVLPIVSVTLGFIDCSITNELIILLLILLFSITFFLSLFKFKTISYYAIPNRWQSCIEFIYILILSLVMDNIKSKRNTFFFPLIFGIFLFLLSLNLIGLIPYSFTLTSHLIVTFSLSLAIFFGINIICIREHKAKFFSIFLPPNTSIILAFLLVPIELISYIFKPVSLSIRLFANMMAGHTLLKVIAGFAFTLMANTGILFLLHYIPLMILIPLFGLELGVALIQSFVYSILLSIYLNDALNLH